MALTDNLISYWKLDEASGNAVDSEPTNPNTMVNQNTMPYGAGKINNAANPVKTGNKHLKIANADQTGLDITGDLSVSFWIKTSETGHYVIFFTDGSSGVGYGVGIGVASCSAGKISAFGGQNWFCNASANRIDDNAWHHVVMTISGTTLIVYLDGVSDGGGTTGSGLSHTGDRKIGGAVTTSIDALIDEVGIWSRALSASEITSLYNGGAGLQYPFPLTLVPSVIDTLSITESTTQTLIFNISVSDTLAITESVTLSNTQLGSISVNDTLSITESTAQTLISNINVTDTLTAIETSISYNSSDYTYNSVIPYNGYYVNVILISNIPVSDILIVTESVTASNGQLGGINVSDILTVTESVLITQFNFISVTDTLTVTENVTQTLFSLINVTDTLTVTENVTTFETEEGGNPSVLEALSITENVIVSMPTLGNISLNETLSILENVITSNATLGSININHSLAITESITLENFRFSPSKTVPVGSVRVFSPYGR